MRQQKSLKIINRLLKYCLKNTYECKIFATYALGLQHCGDPCHIMLLVAGYQMEVTLLKQTTHNQAPYGSVSYKTIVRSENIPAI